MIARHRSLHLCAAGLTLIELLFTLAIGMTLAVISVPLTDRAVHQARAAGAARYVAARIMRIRMDAARQSRAVGLRFVQSGDDYLFAPFADGNGNGVRTTEIAAGIDPQLEPFERLSDRFAGLRFFLPDGTPDADGTAGTGTDGVRIGAARLLVLSVDGSATPGTLYVEGRGGLYAIRVLGATGRTRVLAFDLGARTWRPY